MLNRRVPSKLSRVPPPIFQNSLNRKPPPGRYKDARSRTRRIDILANYIYISRMNIDTIRFRAEWSLLNKDEIIRQAIISPEKFVTKELTRWEKWKRYKRAVRRYSEKQPIHTLENFEKRGFNEYHLDHIFSIWDGFKHDIPVEVVGQLSNLRFIPAKQNICKGRKSGVL